MCATNNFQRNKLKADGGGGGLRSDRAFFHFPYLNKSHFQSLCKDFTSGVGAVLMRCPPPVSQRLRLSNARQLPTTAGNSIFFFFPPPLSAHFTQTCWTATPELSTTRRTGESPFKENMCRNWIRRARREAASRVSVLVITCK